MKIAAVTSRFPHPMERGDKLRAQHQLRELARRHEVTLIALSETPVPPAHLAVLADAGVKVHVVERSRLTTVFSGGRRALREPVQVAYFRSGRVESQVHRLIEDEAPDRVFCQLIRTAWAAEGHGIPSVIDFQDAFAAAMRRRAAGRPPGIRRAFEFEAGRIGRAEADAMEAFDTSIVISEQDRMALEVPDPDSVLVMPNGVDTEFFSPAAPGGEASGADGIRPDAVEVAFVGNMGYPPNVRASRMLAEEIMPAVRRGFPGARLLLAGARPSRTVRRLAGPHVEVSGWMDDIRDAYRRARVMVAPLFIGSGQQNKILEAMSMGVPTVTTELVNNPIGACPGEELMVAGSVEEFAQATLELLESRHRAAEISANASAMVRRRFSWNAVGEQLSGIIEDT